MIFNDREEAGQSLAQKLSETALSNLLDNAIVLGLPRGGVVVAHKVAKFLNLPLDIIVTRKIEAPDNPEFALGAVNEEGDLIMDGEEGR